MFDVSMNVMAILSVFLPALPWLSGARWGRKGVWLSAGFVILILCLFAPLFWAVCIATNCGQGAIAIFVLGPIWIASGLFTAASAALAHYYFARRAAKPKHKPAADTKPTAADL